MTPSSPRTHFELTSGRVIRLEELHQRRVYGGLLEGLPTIEMNRVIVGELVSEERTRSGGAEPLLIQPVESPITRDRPYPFGTPSALPSIQCVGRFTSSEPAKDPSKAGSSLTVIWFQDDYAFPLDPAIQEALRTADWNRLAHDWGWEDL